MRTSLTLGALAILALLIAGVSYWAIRENSQSGVWDKATLDRFIANPDQVVSGNKMKPYGGLASGEERAKIIAFLEANSGS
jgi:cytochrome c2